MKSSVLISTIVFLMLFSACASVKSVPVPTSSVTEEAAAELPKSVESKSARDTSAIDRFHQLVNKDLLSRNEFYELFRVAKKADEQGFHVCAGLSAIIAAKAQSRVWIVDLYKDLDLYFAALVGYVSDAYGLSPEETDRLLANFEASPRGQTEAGEDAILEHVANFGTEDLQLLEKLHTRCSGQPQEWFVSFLQFENGADDDVLRKAFRSLQRAGLDKETVWLVVRTTQHVIDPPAPIKLLGFTEEQIAKGRARIIEIFGRPAIEKAIYLARDNEEARPYLKGLCQVFGTQFPAPCRKP